MNISKEIAVSWMENDIKEYFAKPQSSDTQEQTLRKDKG